MKPCIACGHPLNNSATTCERCDITQSTSQAAQPIVSGDDEPSTETGVVWFFAELFARTLMIGIFSVPACFAIAYWLSSFEIATIVAVTAGLIIALGYSLIEMHFRFQSFNDAKS